MATIDSKKLLPSSKKGGSIEKQKFLVPIKSISTKKISSSALKPLDGGQSQGSVSLVVVRKKIIKLKDLVNNSLLLDRKDTSTKRKEEERNKAEKREKKLEEKVKKNDVKTNLIPSIPGQSLFDKINRFIGFTLLGYLFNKYGELLPKLLEFGKVIEPAAKFIEGFAKNLLKGVIDFIEFGYKTYDKVHDTIKNLGVEGAAKTFEDFSKNLNLVLNGAIAAAMIALSTTPKKPGGAAGAVGNRPTLSRTTNLSSYLNRDPQTKLIERRYGNDAARMYELRRSQGASVSRARADVVKRFDKFEGPQRGLAGGTGRGGVFSRGFGKSFNRASLKVLGKGGTNLAKGALGRVPIVGGLLNFAFALAMGENPGRAAAKAVGSTVGAALGTFIPVPFAGTILGGILGDIVGGAMYDTLVGSKQKPQGRAQGGAITRGGQSTVTPSRRLRTKQRKVVPRIQPQKTEPGKNIGGKVKIEDLYGKDEPGTRSPLRAMKKSSEDLKRMKTLNNIPGAMFGAGIDMALGQKPDKKLVTSIGNMFGSVVQSAIDSELNSSFNDITKTFAMTNGGVVPSREIGKGLNIGEKIGKFISNALAVSIDSSVNRVFQNLNKELNLEGGPGGSGGPSGLDGGPDVFHGEGAERMWNFFKNKGLSDIAVAGILGNARWESSFSPTARGRGMGPGGSDAIGLFQWGENDRWKKLVEWATSQNLDPWNFDTQLKFAWYEMQNSEKATIPALQAATSASDAAERFRSVYERSRHTEQRRRDAAEGYYQQFKGKTYIPPTPPRPRPRPSGGSGSPQSVTGNLKDTGIRDYSGRPIKFKGIIADAFIDMAAAARRAGINLGSGISSSYRSLEDQKRVYREKYGANWERYMVWNSRHMSGEAFDINWDSAAGIWIRNNANRFGFGYNTYSGESTHFDWVGGYTPNRSSTPRPPSPPSRPSSRTTRTVGGILWARNSDGSWRTLTGNPRVVSNAELNQMIIEERRRNQRASLAPNQSSTVATLNRSGVLNTSTDGLIIKETHFVLQKEIQSVMA